MTIPVSITIQCSLIITSRFCSLRRSTAQYIELVAKNEDFGIDNATRDRNSSAIAHQMNPRTSPIGLTVNRFAG
jgi:hypothetical protein